MASGSEVLREYLLALGFRIDKREAKSFDNTVEDIGKTANKTGLALLGVASSAAALAQVYANAMEKLYYSSRHTGSTVQELQALGYAGKQVGVDVSSGIEAVTSALRNRGTRGFMSQLLGRNVSENESPAKLFPELIKALKQSSPDKFVRGKYAEKVGFGAEYFDYEKVVDQLDEKVEEFNKRTAAAGIDLEKIAGAMHEWNQMIGRVASSFETLEGVIAMKALGPMHQLLEATSSWMDILARDINVSPTAGSYLDRRLKNEGRGTVGGWGAASPDGGWFGKDSDIGSGIGDWLRSFANGGRGTGAPSAGSGSAIPGPGGAGTNPATGGYTKAQIDKAMADLEIVYDLPPGTLGAIMQVETGGGVNLTSKTGVQGPMQITAKNFYSRGGTNRNDMMENLSVAAQMLHENMAGGHDIRQAASMYGNGTYKIGEANAGGDPNYVAKFDKAIAQTNHITIHSDDPNKIKAGVEGAMATSNGDLVRNMKGGIQ